MHTELHVWVHCYPNAHPWMCSRAQNMGSALLTCTVVFSCSPFSSARFGDCHCLLSVIILQEPQTGLRYVSGLKLLQLLEWRKEGRNCVSHRRLHFPPGEANLGQLLLPNPKGCMRQKQRNEASSGFEPAMPPGPGEAVGLDIPLPVLRSMQVACSPPQWHCSCWPCP